MLPTVNPMRLSRRFKSFDSGDYLFEIKHDGFRALAYIENGPCRLVSRNGNRFRSFGTLEQWIARTLKNTEAILDGEVVCVDESGRSVFKDVLFRRGECRFFAFDVLWLNGEDLRELPLVERKARLKRLLARKLRILRSRRRGDSLRQCPRPCNRQRPGDYGQPQRTREVPDVQAGN